MTRPADPVLSALPASWRFAYLAQQTVTLVVAGAALLLATWTSPLYDAIFANLPDLLFPPGIVVPIAVAVPLLGPIVVGFPLALWGHRAPLLALLAILTIAAGVAVLEVSSLNWFAFSTGIAFRIESGPVPYVRAMAGLAVVLCALLLIAHQSVQRSLHHLAERGVTRGELREVRAGMLAAERVLVGAALAGGAVLTAVAAISFGASEGAPDRTGSIVVPMLWTIGLLAVLGAAFGWGAWRRHRAVLAGTRAERS